MHLRTKIFYPLSLLILAFLVLAFASCAQTDTSVQSEEAVVTETSGAIVAPTPEPTVVPLEIPATESPAELETTSEDGGQRTFALVQDRSEVRFIIEEVLRGQPTTVIGVNNLISGEVLIDPADSTVSQVSTITVDANNFVTDSNQRNSAIRRFILLPGQYPSITFTPANVSGLPNSVSVGDTFNIQVTGNLTILAATNPVTFNLTVNVLSEDELGITGSTTIERDDYGITIPSVPFVASVEEEVVLELDLVAVARG